MGGQIGSLRLARAPGVEIGQSFRSFRGRQLAHPHQPRQCGGNLGGQFGLQGGNQSGLLIKLIQQVIGSPRDWAPLRGINLVGQRQPGQETDDTTGDPEGNDLGYYPPARALVSGQASSRSVGPSKRRLRRASASTTWSDRTSETSIATESVTANSRK